MRVSALLAHPRIKESRFILPRYLLVGVTSFALGTLTLWLLTDKAHWFYLISGVAGAVVSITTDFTLNESWTFSGRRKQGFLAPRLHRRFLKLLMSKAVGLVIAFSVLALGTQAFRIHYLISNLLGIAASFVWNYALSYRWVWAGKSVTQDK
jgi:putative flippase GtrA